MLHAALRATDERGFSVDVPENTALISALLDGGADVNARDTSDFTPLRLAVLRKGELGLVRLLLDKGADVNARDNQGQTPLMVAAFFNTDVVIEELLGRGADANARSNFGSTALMHAVNHLTGAGDRIRPLLAYGADVSIRDKHGRTALSFVENRHEIPEATLIAEILRKAAVDSERSS